MEDVSMLRFLFVFMIFLSSNCLAQKIEGEYSLKVNADEGNREFVFTNDKFSDIYIGHAGTRIVGGGDYKVVDKKLILNYRQQGDQDTAVYTIDKQPISNTAKSHLSVKILDEQNRPMAGLVSLVNYSGATIATIVTDTAGKCNFITSERDVKFLEINYIGYSKAKIELKSLAGFNATIKTVLHPQTTTYRVATQAVYTIDDLSSKAISLYSKQEGKLQLIKVN